MADEIIQYNYLFITKNGKCFNRQGRAWSEVLSWYIENHVGYGSTCKLDKSSWTVINNNILKNAPTGKARNTARINFFNSICRNPGLRIKKVIFNHTMLYPSDETAVLQSSIENKTFFLVNAGGKYFSYKNISLADALKMYISDNCAFNVTTELWDEIYNSVIATNVANNTDDDTLNIDALINAFNVSCKRNDNKIVALAIEASSDGNIYGD